MKEKILCPSMMCADYGALKDDVIALDQAGIDIFHCDVMDGMFVPNITMGIMDIKAIRKYTNKLIDVHLMIEHPSTKIDLFIDAGADLIYIHPEAERYVVKTLAYIKAKGKLAGIAVNPDTSIETIHEMLNLVDYIMVMSVNPGFVGQQFIDFTKNKIKKLVSMKKVYDFKLIVDGAMSPKRIKEMSELGVDGFILGTSALFGKENSYQHLIEELRAS